MAYFEWAQDMVIDNGPIDDDHRLLVDQVNLLHTATSQGRGQEVVAQLLGSSCWRNSPQARAALLSCIAHARQSLAQA